MNGAFVASAFAAIFVVVNPISKVIVFPMLTEGYTREERVQTISIAITASFVTFVTFGIFGRFIFSALHVDHTALRLTGAIIMLLIGLDMIQGKLPRTKPGPEETKEVEEKKMVGVFPLAIPFISGPAGIITVMLYLTEAPGPIEGIMVLVTCAVVCIITMLFLLESPLIFERIGNVGIRASSRVMGMIILAIGFQMLITAATAFIQDVGLV
jgi:multiple antibiotic resistance protein